MARIASYLLCTKMGGSLGTYGKTGMVCFVTNMNDRKLSCWTVIDFFWLFRYECNALEVLHT